MKAFYGEPKSKKRHIIIGIFSGILIGTLSAFFNLNLIVMCFFGGILTGWFSAASEDKPTSRPTPA